MAPCPWTTAAQRKTRLSLIACIKNKSKMADHEDAEFQRLLKNAFQDEALRRMARKAGVHGASRKETDDVNQALRALGYRILDNFCEKLAVYTEHRKSKTVSEQDFRNTCDLLKIKLDFLLRNSVARE